MNEVTLTTESLPCVRASRHSVGIGIVLAILVWGGAVALGFGLLLQYKNAPNDAGAPPSTWPGSAEIRHSAHRSTLLVFSHPHCPCTRATFRELDRIVAPAPDRVDVIVIFAGLGGVVGSPETTSLAPAARNLGMAKVIYNDGELAKRFQVRTSGHVLLYDEQGRLQFSGGVTASRGHDGESIGGKAISALLLGKTAEVHTASVFGCALFAAIRDCNPRGCPDRAGERN